jgi:hypothetical protein
MMTASERLSVRRLENCGRSEGLVSDRPEARGQSWKTRLTMRYVITRSTDCHKRVLSGGRNRTCCVMVRAL